MDEQQMTDEQLNVAVAKARGYRFIPHCKVPDAYESIIDPSGKDIGGGTRNLPPCTTDMNAAWELVKEASETGQMEFARPLAKLLHIRDCDWGTVYTVGMVMFGTLFSSGLTPRMICEAYLAWHTARQATGETA